MNKNLTYKDKTNYRDCIKKEANIKMELTITSNHNISDDLLNQINAQFKSITIWNYEIVKDKPKIK